MTSYDLAEAFAEFLAQRSDVEDMSAPESDEPKTTFFVSLDGESFEVVITKI